MADDDDDEEFGEFLQGPTPQIGTQEKDQKIPTAVFQNATENKTVDHDLQIVDEEQAISLSGMSTSSVGSLNWSTATHNTAQSTSAYVSSAAGQQGSSQLVLHEHISTRVPEWCQHSVDQLSSVYEQVLEATLVDGEISTERLRPILAASGLTRERLAQIWSICNVRLPGHLVRQELWAVLALIGLTQVDPAISDVPSPQLVEPVISDVLSPQLVEPVISDVLSPQQVDPAISDVPSPQLVEPVISDVLSPQLVEPVISDVLSPQQVDPVISDVLSPQQVDLVISDVPSPQLVDLIISDVPSPQLVEPNNSNAPFNQHVDSINVNEPLIQLLDTVNADVTSTQPVDQVDFDSQFKFTTALTNWETASYRESGAPKSHNILNTESVFHNPGVSDSENDADCSAISDKCIPLTGHLPRMPDLTSQYWIEIREEGANRCSHEWERCLRCCWQVISEANAFLGSIASSAICTEVLKSTQGLQYVSGLLEIYRMICRVATSMRSTGISTTELEQTLKDIDIVWNNLTAFLAGASLLTKQDSLVFTHCMPESDLEDSQNLACGVCLLSVDPAPFSTSCCGDTNSGKLTYCGRPYHATCANFWVNCVGQTLPALRLSNLL